MRCGNLSRLQFISNLEEAFVFTTPRLKDFTYGQEWNGKFYTTKQVRPIFVEEDDEIVVVTVYVYYF
jgi:hypothetical protein